MRFTKMQGCGNDFIVVDCISQEIGNPSELAIKMCNRHFGAGADGLICILPSDTADFHMRIFNPDGTEAEMCGNGIRCLGKYVYDHGLSKKKAFKVETMSGIRKLLLEGGNVSTICVDMGRPGFPQQILSEDAVLKKGENDKIALSVGTPHVVIRVHTMESFEELAPQLCRDHEANVGFVKVLDKENIEVRIWERGVGKTLSCGTGACAAAVVCALHGWTDDAVTVHMPGGELQVEYSEDGRVYMSGPAEEVFSGEWTK